MRGSIVTRNGHHSIVLEMGRDAITGKRKQHWIAVEGNKKEAERQLNEMLHQQQNGAFIIPSKITVGDFLTSWLKDIALPNMTPRTYEGYEFIVRKYIIPELGQVLLTSLKAQNIQSLCGKIQAAGKHRTGQYVFNTLNKAMRSAIKMGTINRNPCEGVESPKVPNHEMHTLSESDLHLFLEYARSTPYYGLSYLALFTGLRRSELLALRWADLDLVMCQLSVNRTMHVMRYGTYKGQVIFKQPKTAKSRRLIALSPSTAIVLREHRQSQDQVRQSLSLATVADDDFIFCHYTGEPLLPDSISHAWMKLARHAGLKDVRFHDARHSHASLMLKQGVHPKVVQERLGHASIETTLDTYSHVAPGMQELAANNFDDMVIGKSSALANR
jgi:integrase